MKQFRRVITTNSIRLRVFFFHGPARTDYALSSGPNTFREKETEMKRLLVCTVLAVLLLGNAFAQDRNIQHRRTYVVKRDRMAEWESAFKDLNAVYKKAKVDAPTLVFQSVTGPDRFMVVRYYEKISQAVASRNDAFKNNHEAEYLTVSARLAAAAGDREAHVSERDAELSLPRATEIPPYIRTIHTVVKPDRIEEYRGLIKEWVSSGVKPSGQKVYLISRTRLGGPGSEFYSGMGVQALTELDDPGPRKAMGEAKYKAWIAKRDAVIVSSEANLFRYRPELSSWTAPK
jgi:hypothetical protein